MSRSLRLQIVEIRQSVWEDSISDAVVHNELHVKKFGNIISSKWSDSHVSYVCVCSGTQNSGFFFGEVYSPYGRDRIILISLWMMILLWRVFFVLAQLLPLKVPILEFWGLDRFRRLQNSLIVISDCVVISRIIDLMKSVRILFAISRRVLLHVYPNDSYRMICAVGSSSRSALWSVS